MKTGTSNLHTHNWLQQTPYVLRMIGKLFRLCFKASPNFSYPVVALQFRASLWPFFQSLFQSLSLIQGCKSCFCFSCFWFCLSVPIWLSLFMFLFSSLSLSLSLSATGSGSVCLIVSVSVSVSAFSLHKSLFPFRSVCLWLFQSVCLYFYLVFECDSVSAFVWNRICLYCILHPFLLQQGPQVHHETM